jgi:hypothetical protein
MLYLDFQWLVHDSVRIGQRWVLTVTGRVPRGASDLHASFIGPGEPPLIRGSAVCRFQRRFGWMIKLLNVLYQK